MSDVPYIHIVTYDSARSLRLGDLLGVRGYRVALSRTVEEALANVSREPPDLLIGETALPIERGEDLCRRVKGNPRTLRTSVILLSPFADVHDMRAGLQAGADDFLVGPYDPEALADRVETFLSSRVSREREEVEKELVLHGAARAERCPDGLPLDRANCENEKMEAVARLAGVAAHDFNNKLMVIKGFSDVLDLSIDVADANHQFVLEIGKAIEQAASFTDQLSLIGGRARHEIGPVDIGRMLGELRPLLSESVGPRVLLDIGHSSDVGTVAAEATLLKQAILSLCLNARDAMPNGGRLVVEAGRTGSREDHSTPGADSDDYVAIEVRDNGTGMNVDTLAHIFEPYYTTKEKSAGLGLTIVYVTMKQLGGRIECSSVPGSGTRFRLLLRRFDSGGSVHEGT